MTAQSERVALTGNEAGALALKQVVPDVVAAYPITPQTELMQQFAQYVADGEVSTEMILVESEHSAMSAVIGAAAAGVRACTATSANGLALMWEMLWIAAGYRLPITMALVSRSLGGPLNIHGDHSDAMGARETGWIQLFSENAQEVYDNSIMAFRIAEHPAVRLPVMVVQDGFITSHTTMVLDVMDDDSVRKFVGKLRPKTSLSNLAEPITYGSLTLPDHFTEVKRQEVQAIAEAPRSMTQIAEEFAALTGRVYGPLELYRMEDAEIAILLMGSAAGTAKDAIDRVRETGGTKIGLVKIRQYRPFPSEELSAVLTPMRTVAAFDRAIAFGAPMGPLGLDAAATLAVQGRIPPLANYVYGLGGRDITMEDFEAIFAELAEIATTGILKERIRFVGVHP